MMQLGTKSTFLRIWFLFNHSGSVRTVLCVYCVCMIEVPSYSGRNGNVSVSFASEPSVQISTVWWLTQRHRKVIIVVINIIIIFSFHAQLVHQQITCSNYSGMTWLRLHRARGGTFLHFYKWLDTGAPWVEEQQTINWPKLYWPSRMRLWGCSMALT